MDQQAKEAGLTKDETLFLRMISASGWEAWLMPPSQIEAAELLREKGLLNRFYESSPVRPKLSAVYTITDAGRAALAKVQSP